MRCCEKNPAAQPRRPRSLRPSAGRIAPLLALLLAASPPGVLSACAASPEGSPAAPAAAQAAPQIPESAAAATFAGGCFWCMEPPFDELDGVLSTTSGYTGGSVESPSYEQVTSGRTGHLEAVQVIYEPEKVSYEELLEVFWRNIDPTDRGGQFCDRGQQYTTAVFAHDDEQRRSAEASKRELEASGRFEGPLATEIRAAAAFYPAEEYHQDFYRKSPTRYKSYRYGCGRDRRLQQLWGEEPEP